MTCTQILNTERSFKVNVDRNPQFNDLIIRRIEITVFNSRPQILDHALTAT